MDQRCKIQTKPHRAHKVSYHIIWIKIYWMYCQHYCKETIRFEFFPCLRTVVSYSLLLWSTNWCAQRQTKQLGFSSICGTLTSPMTQARYRRSHHHRHAIATNFWFFQKNRRKQGKYPLCASLVHRGSPVFITRKQVEKTQLDFD